jgi:hypothetical protein
VNLPPDLAERAEPVSDDLIDAVEAEQEYITVWDAEGTLNLLAVEEARAQRVFIDPGCKCPVEWNEKGEPTLNGDPVAFQVAQDAVALAEATPREYVGKVFLAYDVDGRRPVRGPTWSEIEARRRRVKRYRDRSCDPNVRRMLTHYLDRIDLGRPTPPPVAVAARPREASGRRRRSTRAGPDDDHPPRRELDPAPREAA